MSNTITSTGKNFENIGEYVTIRQWDSKTEQYYESKPFIHVNELPKLITWDIFKYILGNRVNKWINFFGEDILKAHVEMIPVFSFMQTHEWEEVEGTTGALASILDFNNAMLYGKRTLLNFTQYRGEWERHYKAFGFRYLRLSCYSSWESNFIRACLLDKFPYLNEFNFDVYAQSYGHESFEKEELYIKVMDGDKGLGSLYVPFKTFSQNDFSCVVDRMTSYWNWYYATDEKLRNKQLALLDSPEAYRLKDLLSK